MKNSAFLLAILPLAACAPMPPESAPPPAMGGDGQCNPAPAAVLVGQTASAQTGARALGLIGADRLRWGPPRSAFTMDYRHDRVNVMYDDAMVITEVTCG